MSSIVNKVKDALSDKDRAEQPHTAAHGTHGTHATHNTADPRVQPTHVGGAAHQGGALTGTGNYTHGADGVNRGTSGPAAKTDGPHKSDLLNKADPRVDSDRDHSTNLGMNPQGTATTNTSAAGVHRDHPHGGVAGTTHHAGTTHAHQHTTTGTAGTGSFGTGPATTTAGPHSSNVANKADPRVDSDLDRSRNIGMGTHGHQTTQHHGTATSGIAGTHSATTGPASNTAGPHSSNVANKADPRVDSDLDSTRRAGLNHPHGTGVGGAEPAFFSGGHNTAGTTTTGPAATTAGPHSSNIANKADPRIDSDLDGSRNMGMNQPGHTTGTAGVGQHGHQTHGTHHGVHAQDTRATGPATSTAGPHSSNIANKADPRIDSDLDGNRRVATGQAGHTTVGTTGTTGTTGQPIRHGYETRSTGPATTTAGPHSSNAANKADPRVDSDLDHSRNAGLNTHTTTAAGTTGNTSHHTSHTTGTGHHQHANVASTGPAPNTAGPHKSDMLNKLDPRVDSDLDGSKTVGGNKTFETTK